MRIPPVAMVGLLLTIATISCNEFELIEEDVPEQTGATLRPATATSQASCTQVFDYRPAPGQFINDETMGELENSEAAVQWAQERLDAGKLISLGAFGGYVVVGFDHSIVAGGGYDFAVGGNAFINAGGASNEPGIVWVMQDENGNGEPDDTWYALKGADWDEVRSVTITYTRPTEAGQSVQWSTSSGQTGEVDYLPELHKQPSYYPTWMGASITFTGLSLPARIYRDSETGQWRSEPYSWGYADNCGDDAVEIKGLRGQFTGFKISNAVDDTGASVRLQFIDFVKIQTAVIGQSGHLGESSTEVTGVYDLAL